MKLTFKLFSLMALVMIGSLSLFGYFAYRSEMRQFEIDLRDECRVLGHAMSVAVADVWQTQGKAGALRLVRDANAAGTHPRVGWVWLSRGKPVASRPGLGPREVSDLLEGREVLRREPGEGGDWYLRAYFPIRTPDGAAGALELSQPASNQHRFARRHSLRLASIALIILIVAGGLMAIVGEAIIGRRVRELGEQARRIGEGDFSVQVPERGKDELSRLATAMNAMARHLTEMQEGLRREHEAHINTIESLRHAERLATLGQLASGVAHELGTPLNVVAGRAKLIAREELDVSEITDSAAIISEQAARMTDMIERLLDFARRRPPRITEFDLPQLVRKVREMMAQIAAERGVSFDLEGCEADAELPVRGDPDQIRQVLVNLVMNGIGAMPEGGRLSVTLGRTRTRPSSAPETAERDCVRIEVRDEGVGISAENLPHVTEPYFTTKPTGAGTGLGLSIVQGIVEEHGGWLEINSSVGDGTRVAVCLPEEDEG